MSRAARAGGREGGGFDGRPVQGMAAAGMEFEWDETKRRANLAKHRIDFVDAKEIWQGDVLEIESSQDHLASRATLPMA